MGSATPFYVSIPVPFFHLSIYSRLYLEFLPLVPQERRFPLLLCVSSRSPYLLVDSTSRQQYLTLGAVVAYSELKARDPPVRSFVLLPDTLAKFDIPHQDNLVSPLPAFQPENVQWTPALFKIPHSTRNLTRASKTGRTRSQQSLPSSSRASRLFLARSHTPVLSTSPSNVERNIPATARQKRDQYCVQGKQLTQLGYHPT